VIANISLRLFTCFRKRPHLETSITISKQTKDQIEKNKIEKTSALRSDLHITGSGCILKAEENHVFQTKGIKYRPHHTGKI